MASFSDRLRFAYHVTPIHALKSILSERRLLSKAALNRNGVHAGRATTRDVDSTLGFSELVHFYLPKGTSLRLGKLSILKAQLGESKKNVSPFPHAVFVIDTTSLSDSECMICNCNIAVSRLSYGQVKGGNHSRGTTAEAIYKHWTGFRNDNPDRNRMKRSHWHDGYSVPLLIGDEITADPKAVGFNAPSGVAELLLESPFDIGTATKLYVFSKHDQKSVSALTSPLTVELDESCYPWYAERDRVAPDVRAQIDRFFADDDAAFPKKLDFDQQR